VNSSIRNVLFGTFTLRFSTGLTGGLLAFYLANLEHHGGVQVSPEMVGVLYAAFYATELIASPFFGLLSDRLGHHRVMQYGPIFGIVAVTITGLTTNLLLIGGTRVLEGAAAAASIPSILGYLAMATTNDELLRGKTSARFELATLGGIGAGTLAAGILYDGIPGVWAGLGALAFFLNAGIYGISFLIYRYGVHAPDHHVGPHDAPEFGLSRYVNLLRRSHIWLLAPTWIAVNAAIGVYSGQGLFNLIRIPDPRFENQLLAGGLSGLELTIGLLAAGAVFVAGLVYWGNRFKTIRRTTILFYGILGGVVLVIGALAFNHSGALDPILRSPFALVAGAGLFVLAGATPAALGLLADMSEAYPDDRGAVMGLYSVFLGIGQILGSLIGGWAAERAAIDGLLVATLVMMGVALLPLYFLRQYEHQLDGSAPPATA
jgi:MFS family permease